MLADTHRSLNGWMPHQDFSLSLPVNGGYTIPKFQHHGEQECCTIFSTYINKLSAPAPLRICTLTKYCVLDQITEI